LGLNNLPGFFCCGSEFAGTFLDLSFFNVMVYELHPMRNIITDTITPKSNPFNLFTTMWFHNNEI